MLFEILPHWTLTANSECQPSPSPPLSPANAIGLHILCPADKSTAPQEQMIYTSFQINPSSRFWLLYPLALH